MTKPTLKKRSFRSGWRALAWAMMKASYSRAIFPSSSVSSPGMSMAHSRANFTWSRSSTSSLKACSAPSGNAIRRTGMSSAESQLAAFTRCFRCSRLILMSLRRRIPRTAGIRPTAVYGFTTTGSSWDAVGPEQPRFANRLKREPERKLYLPGRRDELWRSKSWVARTRDVVAELLRHRSGEIWQTIDVVNVFHIHTVKDIEYLEAEFAMNAVADRNDALQSEVRVVIGIAFIAITGADAHPVRERKQIAIGVESGIDGEPARASQAGQQGKLEVTHDNRPFLRRFCQEGKREPVADVVVADRPVKFRMQVVLRSIGKVDRRRDIDGLGVGVVRQEIQVVRKSLPQARGTGVIEGKPDGLYVQNK